MIADLEQILVELQHEHRSMTNFDHQSHAFVLFCLKNQIRCDKVHQNCCLVSIREQKALDMPRRRLLTSISLSSDIKILWVIDSSWLIQESPGWKPGWYLDMSLLGKKQLNISLKITLSNILPQIGDKETGRQFLLLCLLLFL